MFSFGRKVSCCMWGCRTGFLSQVYTFTWLWLTTHQFWCTCGNCCTQSTCSQTIRLMTNCFFKLHMLCSETAGPNGLSFVKVTFCDTGLGEISSNWYAALCQLTSAFIPITPIACRPSSLHHLHPCHHPAHLYQQILYLQVRFNSETYLKIP